MKTITEFIDMDGDPFFVRSDAVLAVATSSESGALSDLFIDFQAEVTKITVLGTPNATITALGYNDGGS